MTLVCLAWMAVLLTTELPDPQGGWILDELRNFRRELDARAARAREIAAKLTPGKPTARTWEDVLDEGGDG